MQIQDRVAVVTGGASGIGKGICTRLAEEGGKVAIFDMDHKGAQRTAKSMDKTGRRALAFKVDVSRASEIKAAITQVVSYLGEVDILVNNAGVSMVKTVREMTEEVWDRVHDVNLKGVFLCCKAVADQMMERRYGKIVNISSVLGNEGATHFTHYCSTKAGVIGFTRGLAVELAPYNINVNAIGPGLIDTPLLRAEFSALGQDPDLAFQGLKQRIPLGRIGEPRDIANAVLFLVSEESSYITGQCLFVSGGWSAS